MDKYEYKLKLDQMKSLTAEGKYEEAAEIADTINWHKIKNINALVKVGEIYEKVGRYDESKDVLLTAYDKSPIGRMQSGQRVLMRQKSIIRSLWRSHLMII